MPDKAKFRVQRPIYKPRSESRMSIEMSLTPQTPAMASIKHRSKSDKKHKSSCDEKKRKREHGEDGHRSTSKKRRGEDQERPESSSITKPSTSSPFHVQTSSMYLPLAPVSQKYPLEGMCAEHISPLILTYYPPFNGVLLSYSNPRLSEKPFGNDGETLLLQSIDEFAVSWAWVTAEFLLFKPEKGALLEGYVNLQNEGHLGFVCWNLFNASIERQRLPSDWKWVGVGDTSESEQVEQGKTYAEEGIGYYLDGGGDKVDGILKFRVREIESSHDRERGFLGIAGTMLDEDAEKELQEREREKTKSFRDNAGRRLGGSKALGATSLAINVEPDLMDAATGTSKHRRKY